MADGEPAYYRVNDSLSCASNACAKHLSGLLLLAGFRELTILARNYADYTVLRHLCYQFDCPASSSSCSVRNCLISKLRAPAGVRTATSSPSCLPIKLRPTGDVVEISPCAGSLSSG